MLVFLLISRTEYAQLSVQDYYLLSQKQFKVGNYGEALKSNISALKLLESGSDYDAIAYCNIQVGRMYYFLHDKRTALNYFFKSLQIITERNIDSLKFMVNYNMGVMYTELIVADSALMYYKAAENAIGEKPEFINLAKLHGVIADLYMNVTNNLPLAKDHIDKAEKFANLSNDLGWKAFVNIKLCIYYRLKEQYDLSVKYAQLAYQMYLEKGDIDGQMYGLNALAGAMALNKNPEVKNVYEKLIGLKDSVFGVETANKIAEYQTQYETEKKEIQNKLLQQEIKINQTKITDKNRAIIGLVIGLLLIVITAFWRISVINLKKKNKELEASQAVQKEKERISRDLHDNVGGQLSFVLYSLDGMNDSNVQKRSELTSSINESIRNVIGNLRETIWAINDESFTVIDLSDKLKVYVRSMFRNTETNINYIENIKNNIHLNSLVGLNLYRICQEIINNAFKHSNASEIKIEISSLDKITIVIFDNGIGFNLDETAADGFGLSNIKSRANEVGISIELFTELNKGTTYTLVV